MMGRKFSVLQPKDGKGGSDLIRGDASLGMGDIWYFTIEAAEIECQIQGNGMKLFDNKEDAKAFIDNFP